MRYSVSFIPKKEEGRKSTPTQLNERIEYDVPLPLANVGDTVQFEQGGNFPYYIVLSRTISYFPGHCHVECEVE